MFVGNLRSLAATCKDEDIANLERLGTERPVKGIGHPQQIGLFAIWMKVTTLITNLLFSNVLAPCLSISQGRPSERAARLAAAFPSC
jgi:hypothetical protein